MLTQEQMQVEAQKLIQQYMDTCKFRQPDDAGKALGALIMLATMAAASIMGAEYTARTIIQVSELMKTGKPQSRVTLEVIDKSKVH